MAEAAAWLAAGSKSVISERGLLADERLAPENNSAELEESNPSSIVDVTREYPLEYALIMFGYIMPFVLVITLITNFLVIVVLSRRHMRTPTNIVLMTMAFVDIGTLASPSPWYLYIYTFGNHDKYLFPPTTCYAHYVMTDVIPIFLHTSSIWLALLLASQRYIYVCHPTMARTWCTVPRVKRAIIAILLVAFLHQLTHFFDNIFKPTKVRRNEQLQDACRNEMATWVSDIGDNYYYLTYYTFRIFFVFIIPCVALLTLNILLFRALRRAEKKRTELLKTKFKLVDAHSLSTAAAAAAANSRRSNRSHRRHANTKTARGHKEQPLAAVNVSTFEASSYALAATLAQEQQQLNWDSKKQATRGLFARHSPTMLAAATQLNGEHPAADANTSTNTHTQTSTTATTTTITTTTTTTTATTTTTTTTKSDDLHSCRSVSETFGAEQKWRESGNWRRRASSSSDLSGAGLTREDEDEDEESTCAECVAYLALQTDSASCRRCSAGELEVGAGRAARQEQPQPISQCSSILGVANTNTTTTSGRALESDELEQEAKNLSASSSCSENDERSGLMVRSAGGQPDEGQHMRLAKDEQQHLASRALIKSSSSAESRLACGCLTAHAKALRRVHLLSRNKSSAKVTRAGQGGECCQLKLIQSTSSTNAGDSQVPPEQLPSSSLLERPSERLAAEPAANSLGSLPQVTAPSSSEGAELSHRTSESFQNNRLFAALSGRAKSPSFADSTTGRGSRATLMGSSQAGAPEAPHSSSTTLAPGTAAPASHAHQQHQSGRTMDSNRTTLMLIVVVTVFLVVEVPVAAVTITHVVINLFDVFRNVDLDSTLNYIKLFTNFFIMLSYSINFTIYCSMSKKFRETFRDLFFCGQSVADQKQAQRLLYQTQAQHSQYLATNQQFPMQSDSPGRLPRSSDRAEFLPRATPASGLSAARDSNKEPKVTRRLQANKALRTDYLATASRVQATVENSSSSSSAPSSPAANGIARHQVALTGQKVRANGQQQQQQPERALAHRTSGNFFHQ